MADDKGLLSLCAAILVGLGSIQIKMILHRAHAAAAILNLPNHVNARLENDWLAPFN